MPIVEVDEEYKIPLKRVSDGFNINRERMRQNLKKLEEELWTRLFFQDMLCICR